MTVKELIEKLQKIENKDAKVIFSTPANDFDWMILNKDDEKNPYLVIGLK